MEEYFRGQCDCELAIALLGPAKQGDAEAMQELMIQCCPFIRKVVRKVLNVDRPTARQIEADTLGFLYNYILSRDDIPAGHPGSFGRFLVILISRYAIDRINRFNVQKFDYRERATSPYKDQTPQQYLIESAVFHRQCRDQLRRISKLRVRFIGSERSACFSLIDSELGLSDVGLGVVKRRFKLTTTRLNYLIRYVQILLRAALMELRDSEREGRLIPSIWETGGDVLCAPRELGQLHVSS